MSEALSLSYVLAQAHTAIRRIGESEGTGFGTSQARVEIAFWRVGFSVSRGSALLSRWRSRESRLPDLDTGPNGEVVGVGTVTVHPHWDRDEV